MLSPQKAAERAGVSRKTIMDNIHAGKIKAARNNLNRWQIAPEDLEAWLADRVPTNKTDTNTNTYSETLRELEKENVSLKVALQAAEKRVADLEEDRAHWREQASRGLWKRLFG